MADRSTPLGYPQGSAAARLQALDLVDLRVFNDARAIYADLVDHADGFPWSREAAIEALDHAYRSWIVGRIDSAVDDAVALIRMEMSS